MLEFTSFFAPFSWELFQHFLIKALLIISFTATLSYITKRVLLKIQSLPKKNESIQIIEETFAKPLKWLIWGYGTLWFVAACMEYLTQGIRLDSVYKAQHIFLITGCTYLIFCWKRRFQELLARKATNKSDQSLIHVVGKILSIALLVLSGLMVLGVLNVPLTGLLAFGTMGTVAISFASQDVGKNFFGGLMIYLNRPFEMGDWIMSPNKGFEGVVEDIGWYMTRIRTFERRPTYIPNSLITDAIVENPGRMYNRRIKEQIGVRYQDVKAVAAITKAIEKMLYEHKAIDTKQFIMVDMVAFGPSSLNIEVYCFTKTTNWKEYRGIQQDVFLKIASIIDAHKAEIAFPTQTLHLAKQEQEDLLNPQAFVANKLSETPAS